MGEKEPTCLRRVVGTSLSSAERYGATVTSVKMQLSRRGSYVLPRIYFSVLGGDMGCVLEYHRCVFLFESDFFKPTSPNGWPSTPPLLVSLVSVATGGSAMNKLRQSFRRKKDVYVPESSRPHQWQTDEEAVRSGKCSFTVKVALPVHAASCPSPNTFQSNPNHFLSNSTRPDQTGTRAHTQLARARTHNWHAHSCSPNWDTHFLT